MDSTGLGSAGVESTEGGGVGRLYRGGQHEGGDISTFKLCRAGSNICQIVQRGGGHLSIQQGSIPP